MLNTPKKHLPKGYPAASPEESKRFEPVFRLAFEIHSEAHNFGTYPRDAQAQELGPRIGILSPIKGRTKRSRAQYCDCYEQAYQRLASTLSS